MNTIEKLLKKTIPKQFLNFLMVGSIGFTVDALLLYFFTNFFHLNPLVARLFSLFVAMTVTWILNRQITFFLFKSEKRLKEWFHYVGWNSLGALINYAIYSFLILFFSRMAHHPLWALAVASAVVLVFNFTVMKYIIFSSRTC